MVKVPTYDSPQVREQAGPTPRITNPLGVQEATVAGRQISAMGEAASRASGAAFDIALKAQQEANTVRADDAITQLAETSNRLTQNRERTGYRDLAGISALQRPEGKSLADDFGGQLDKSIETINAGLNNDEQRRLFNSRAQQMRANFRAQVGAHEAQEFRTYTASVQEGRINTALDTVLLHYGDAQMVSDALGTIDNAVRTAGNLAGKSAEWIDAQAADAKAKALGGALGKLISENNLTAAQAFMTRYKKELEAAPEVLVEASVKMTAQQDALIALRATDEAGAAAYNSLLPGDFSRLEHLVGLTESTGRDYNRDGTPITSPAGAKYRMQVMPATARDPGFGIRPAASDTPEEYNRVGRELLTKLISYYKGDIRKALAAYNWGPGNVDKTVAEAEAEGVDWFGKLPAGRRPKGQYSPFNDVQGYVNKIHGQFTAGGGRPKPVTEMEFVDNAVARARQMRGGELSASAEIAVRSAAGQKWGIVQRSFQDEQTGRVNEIISMVNGGMSPAQIRATPAWLGLTPEAQSRTSDFVEGRQAKNQFANYLELSDPTVLSRYRSEADIRALLPQLGPQLTEQLIGQWRTSGKPEAATIDAEDLKYVAKGLGIDAYKSNPSTAQREQLGLLQFRIEQAIAQEQARQRRPLTRDEKLVVARREAALTVAVKGGMFQQQMPLVLVPDDRLKDIVVPDADRKEIAAQLQQLYRQTNDDRYAPNEGNVRRFYLEKQQWAKNAG